MNKLLQIVKEQLLLLEQSKISLQYSFNESKKLINNNVQEEFSLQQQDVLKHLQVDWQELQTFWYKKF